MITSVAGADIGLWMEKFSTYWDARPDFDREVMEKGGEGGESPNPRGHAACDARGKPRTAAGLVKIEDYAVLTNPRTTTTCRQYKKCRAKVDPFMHADMMTFQ